MILYQPKAPWADCACYGYALQSRLPSARISMEDWSRTINTRKEHRAILDAMASGNADLAESLMAKHIENAKKHMLGGFKNHG